MKLKIITGLSGSGKTTALRAYEDLGYYAMDNAPAYLVEKFIELNKYQEKPIEKMAVVIDFRSFSLDNDIFKSIKSLKEANKDTEIIFIYCNDEIIKKRYNELRRPHPLGEYGNVSDGLEKEKNLLKPLKDISDKLIDTTNYKIAELRQVIESSGDKKNNMIINLISFGYKYGVSADFDFVFDVRFIPNPFYVEELKKLNGTNKKLANYLDQFDIIKDFEDRVYGLINSLLPSYEKEGKNIITIAFGCTGGQHRSVYMVEKMYEKMKNDDYILIKRHREKDKW
ncbi:RNase adapter RapZ [Anaerococcus lactolyticus]|uniref:Kinase n=1 Tax=Anaerococcus lactolyticus S7-1-13 TaxID=1284686 RepID=A0A095X1B7_9FIRM|nr:RNase adapter RapZ [Anaerococcus lactolyticus]KGF03531.1 kinase [Anaerococcus lactolyticus S7-1-13]